MEISITVGMTIHDYVQRRQLTEAAKLLVFPSKPIIEIVFFCGYESQQAFSFAFKSMYKVRLHSIGTKQLFIRCSYNLYCIRIPFQSFYKALISQSRDSEIIFEVLLENYLPGRG